jgi:hypothetical protein
MEASPTATASSTAVTTSECWLSQGNECDDDETK